MVGVLGEGLEGAFTPASLQDRRQRGPTQAEALVLSGASPRAGGQRSPDLPRELPLQTGDAGAVPTQLQRERQHVGRVRCRGSAGSDSDTSVR